MGKNIKKFVWVAIAAIALVFLIKKTPTGDFQEAIKNIKGGYALVGILLYFISQAILACRWVLLLEVQKVQVSLFQAIKLTYLGLFYNNMMPGAVGGDLLKGWYITRHSNQTKRLEAVVTVFVDRLMGLTGMMLIGALASLFIGPELKITILEITVQVRVLIWGLLLTMIVVSTIMFSRSIRRFLRLSPLLEKLPFAKKLRRADNAIRLYGAHLSIVLMTLVLTGMIQGLSMMAVWMLTKALGFEHVTFTQCLSILPIVWLVSAAVPVPGGLGVMENLFIPFFSAAISPDNPAAAVGSAAALALLNRIMIYICSIPGALVPIFGGHLPNAEDIEADMEMNDPMDEQK